MAQSDKGPRRGARGTRKQHTALSGLAPRGSRPAPAGRPLAGSRASGRAALIIFTKAPIPGEVKTRLCPPLVPDEAATLHGSLLLDVMERTRLSGIDRYVAAAPTADHVFFKIMEARHHVKLFSQQGADLGERMQHAFGEAFTRGCSKAILIGADVPAMSGSLVSQALILLDAHEVVLGPALDGGYYLIGLSRLVPELFRDMTWSSDRVCALTQDRARLLGLHVGMLPSHRDLDTVDDVLAMAEAARREAGGPRQEKTRQTSSPSPLAPSLSKRTASVLRDLAERIRSRQSRGHATAER